MPRATRVALALGGGGARGYAHIGVVQVLEERGYEIVNIAGTSMGALVGGLHAAGKLAEYTDWVCGLTQRDVIRLLDPSLRAPGAIRGQKILAKVSELLDGATFEELGVPFTAVATDLIAGKEVWFQRGPVDVAIRAAIALPSFITPVVLHGRLLADGGLLNPVPVAATAASSADLTVAVSLAEEHLTSKGTAPTQESSATDGDEVEGPLDVAESFDSDLVRTITGWFTGGGASAEDAADDALDEGEGEDAGPFGALPSGLRTVEVMQLAVDAMQSVITRFRLAGYPPDLLITIPKTSARTLDFHRAGEMIELGRERAAQALDRGSPFALG